jgi:hypothetical protein
MVSMRVESSRKSKVTLSLLAMMCKIKYRNRMSKQIESRELYLKPNTPQNVAFVLQNEFGVSFDFLL